eukprot:803766-Rhodomonas_salina.2
MALAIKMMMMRRRRKRRKRRERRRKKIAMVMAYVVRRNDDSRVTSQTADRTVYSTPRCALQKSMRIGWGTEDGERKRGRNKERQRQYVTSEAPSARATSSGSYTQVPSKPCQNPRIR